MDVMVFIDAAPSLIFMRRVGYDPSVVMLQGTPLYSHLPNIFEPARQVYNSQVSPHTLRLHVLSNYIGHIPSNLPISASVKDAKAPTPGV